MNRSDELHGVPNDRRAVVLIAAASTLTAAVYILLYSPAVDRAVAANALGAEAATFWLRLHILSYTAAYLLLGAGFAAAVLYRRAGKTSSFPWVEVAVVVAAVLTLVGVTTGERFAGPLWGLVPTWSDPKLSVATVTAWSLVLFGSPLAIWARLRFNSSRRYFALAVITFVGLSLGTVSLLLGRFTRSMHPYPISPWWP
jgi:hypothetical protein